MASSTHDHQQQSEPHDDNNNTTATHNDEGSAIPSSPPSGRRPSEVAAAHAVEHAASWTPSLDRRMSWSREDQKRELHAAQIIDDVTTGPGFSERKAGQ